MIRRTSTRSTKRVGNHAKGKIMGFISKNPPSLTPNPIVNETLAALEWLFTMESVLRVGNTMVNGLVALSRCTENKRAAVFRREWNRWCNAEINRVKAIYNGILEIGLANVECAPPDPASWAFDRSYRLIAERLLSLPNCYEHVVDFWVRPLCGAKEPEDTPPDWIDVYSVTKAQPRCANCESPDIAETSTPIRVVCRHCFIGIANRGILTPFIRGLAASSQQPDPRTRKNDGRS
jgi:hypothetical protein